MGFLLVNSRRIFQLASFAFFLYLFALAAYPLDTKLPVDIFLSSDPLNAVSSGLASRSVSGLAWFFVPMLAIGILAGRIFCGWICPLGAIFDAADKIFARHVRKRLKLETPDSLRSLKYGILLIIFAAAAFGFHIAGWLDPISLVTRTFAAVIYPFAFAVFSGTFGSPSETTWLANYFPLEPPVYELAWFFGIIGALLILALAFKERFWCRYLCPLGALYGIIGRFRIFRIEAGAGCTSCGACDKVCPTGAIKKGIVLQTECTSCMSCVAKCPKKSLAPVFSISRAPVKPPSEKPDFSPAMTRRGALAAFAVSAATIPLLHFTSGEKRAGENLLRPPGALPEDEFLSKCSACGECVKVCPNNAIHLSFMEAGLAGFMTPRLVFEIGWCMDGCNLCTQVCPTGAIQKMTIEEKEKMKIGLAKLDELLCLPYAKNTNCGVCEEHCPMRNGYEKAINFTETGEVSVSGEPLRKPVISKELCNGCGECVTVCPERPRAVRVFRIKPN